MQPWIIDASRDPDIALRVRQTGREVIAIGGYLWDMIGRPEPFDVGAHAIRLAWVDPKTTFQYGYDADVIFSAVHRLRTGGGDDVIFQTGWSSELHAEAGDDFISGWSDDALMTGGAGDDTLLGGAGQDLIYGGSGSNLLYGGDGEDRILTSSDKAWAGGETVTEAWIAAKRLSQDEIHGGAGGDYVTSSYGSDRLHGGDGDDMLRAQDGDDLLDGGAGDDRLFGDNGADSLLGGYGADLLDAGLGDDLLDGGEGHDSLSGGNGGDGLDGGGGHDSIDGGYGADVIDSGAGNDRIDGGGHGDVIRAGDGNDIVLALEDFGRGNDLVLGEGGNDTLHGGRGSDRIDGGAGDDRLSGGAGDDTLTGGEGTDVFVVRAEFGVETITDFGADDRLAIADDVTGGAISGLRDPSVRLVHRGDGAWIEFGNGNAIHLPSLTPEDFSRLIDHQASLI